MLTQFSFIILILMEMSSDQFMFKMEMGSDQIKCLPMVRDEIEEQLADKF
jgi:hypothetical protein